MKTKAQLNFPACEGRDKGRGYLFTRPVPVANFPDGIRAVCRSLATMSRPWKLANTWLPAITHKGNCELRAIMRWILAALYVTAGAAHLGAGQVAIDNALLGAFCAKGDFPHQEYSNSLLRLRSSRDHCATGQVLRWRHTPSAFGQQISYTL
jgi:hypothetical protein